jgi:hypothetical protein
MSLYPPRMDSIALALLGSGLALFVAGDALWLVRNTFKRPMDMRITGGLVGAGVLLMAAGLAVLAASK